MNLEFQVSVIIPVYKAENFLRKAVESANNIPVVEEILLVEDNSPDNSLAICKELAATYRKVIVLQHPNRENRGAGASRNLGIIQATSNFVAFLDADDYYLPDRFEYSKDVFEKFPEVEFTFGVAQYDYNFEAGNTIYKGMKPGVKGESLFYNMLVGNMGYFCTNNITIKRQSLLKVKLFNTDLSLHQDSELWLRMAYYLNGKQEANFLPTAVVRVHPGNRISNRNNTSKFKLWNVIKKEFEGTDIKPRFMNIVLQYWKYYGKNESESSILGKLRYYYMILKVRSL